MHIHTFWQINDTQRAAKKKLYAVDDREVKSLYKSTNAFAKKKQFFNFKIDTEKVILN